MCLSPLNDPAFHNSLIDFDRLIAEQARKDQCLSCGGNLHQSHYVRKPRGVPKGVHSDYGIRFSYCCGEDGCRKRFTPPSMRFLSRKVYSSVVIILVFLLHEKTDESKIEELNQFLKTTLSVKTIRRWRYFWMNVVPQSHTWKRAAFTHVMAQTLPASLLSQFQHASKTPLVMVLKWMLPLTAGIHLFDVTFHWVIPG